MDFYLQNINSRLLNSQVSHFNVQTMLLDSKHGIFDVLSEGRFTENVKPVIVRD
jgi:hypothetical protein